MKLFMVNYSDTDGNVLVCLKNRYGKDSFFAEEEAKDCLKHNYLADLAELDAVESTFSGDEAEIVVENNTMSIRKYKIISVDVKTHSFRDKLNACEALKIEPGEYAIASYLDSLLCDCFTEDEFESLCGYLLNVYYHDDSCANTDLYVEVVKDLLDDGATVKEIIAMNKSDFLKKVYYKLD